MSEQKFFRCVHCGNMAGLIRDAGIPMICCGEPMQELIPNTTDAATEKHIPVVNARKRLVHVKIGSTAHPMTEEHHIDFIYLQTKSGGEMKRLLIDTEAAAMFTFLNDTPISVYAYCNLHGLWRTEISDKCLHTEETHNSDGQANETICSADSLGGCK